MRKHRILILSLGLGVVAMLLASTANADNPNDLLPSNLVTVATFGTTCNANGILGKEVDSRQRSDGTQHTFHAASGNVLVITAATLAGTGGSAGHPGLLGLAAVSGPLAESALFYQAHIAMDSNGNMTYQFTFPTGVVVKSGVTLCALALDEMGGTLTVAATLHGYVTLDK
jgi:hypothetical protein